MNRFHSLRVRLVLWTVALEAVLLLIFAVVLITVLRNNQNQKIEETLRLSATQLNAVVDVRGSDYYADVAETADLRGRGVLAWILTPQGTIGLMVGEAENYPIPIALPPPEQLGDGELVNGEPVRLLVTPLQEGNRILGTVVVALSLRESQTFLNQIFLSLAIAIPIVLLLSAGGGLFLANRALAPVAAMTTTAQQISADDLSQRLAFDLPNDEIGRLAHTFNAMLDRLDRAFQRERQFTADASHELRTPLGLLKTQLSLARSRPRDTATLLQMMTDMEGDVDRMTHLVEQMLILARVEQGEAVKFAPVALDTLLNELTQQLQPKAQERQLTLTLEYPPHINLQTTGNASQLQQVFSNLLDNALKFTPVGGQVEVSLNRDWQQIIATVTDNGPGIPPENLPHLFNRFYRVDSARTRTAGGFGLGLAITREIVRLHGGTIDVQSQSGQGTTFTVGLPARPGQ
ncbi:MAG: HAMP domain-containing protein [Anaerolineaceae bacterium]|nr:HAMP domain-containing protein [Anaerolineaceae bacterium]MCB9102263.1 HAMP domain-containing protein [Anaerolineales bacterium]